MTKQILRCSQRLEEIDLAAAGRFERYMREARELALEAEARRRLAWRTYYAFFTKGRRSEGGGKRRRRSDAA